MEKKASTTESSASPESRVRHKGRVLWFEAGKGYGFIEPDDKKINNGKDLFVHFHYIVQRGFKSLIKGDVVEFCVGENKNGKCAHEVKILEAVERPKEKTE